MERDRAERLGRLALRLPGRDGIGVVGAWARATERRLLAILFHLGSPFAPWGYLYPIPLVAVVLAVFAAATFRSSRKVEPGA